MKFLTDSLTDLSTHMLNTRDMTFVECIIFVVYGALRKEFSKFAPKGGKPEC